MSNATYFDTSQFERSHGTTPKGRGGWLLAPYGAEEDMVNFNGTFTEAKKQARQQYPSVDEWVVLP